MLSEKSPSPKKAVELIYNTSSRSMVLLVGECSVEYQGRAKSYLDYGDRLVIVKKDGAVLVHQGETREPVNWQPPGTRPTYHAVNGSLVIRAQRTGPNEYMKIEFKRIDLLTMKELTDNAELKLVGMEEHIVEKIIENPGLIEEGIRICEKERKTSSGSIDLFCKDKENNHVILEVKRGNPGISAAYQLEAYASDFKRKNPDCNLRAILVAPRIPLMVKNRLVKKGLEYREINVRFDLPGDSQSRIGDYF